VKDAKVSWLGLRDYWMIRTLYGCGLRASEVCRLKTTDVDTLKNRYRQCPRRVGGPQNCKGQSLAYVPRTSCFYSHSKFGVQRTATVALDEALSFD